MIILLVIFMGLTVVLVVVLVQNRYSIGGTTKEIIRGKIRNYFLLSKSNLHYTRGITPKRVTGGGPISRLWAWAMQLRRNVIAVVGRWRHCADLTDSGIEPQTSRTESNVITTFVLIIVIVCFISFFFFY